MSLPDQIAAYEGGAIPRGDLARCPVGEARSAPAFGITQAKTIIHTAGPLLHDSGEPRPELLAACYTSCLVAAGKLELESIAFCSMGFHGYPQNDACEVPVAAVARARWLDQR